MRKTLLKGGGAVAAVLVAMMVAGLIPPGSVNATHQPADKVVASGSKIQVLGPRAEVPILKATLRTASTTDLILQLTFECSIFTRLVTGPSDAGGTDSATATGDIRAWIEIDGNIVPINSQSTQATMVTPLKGDESDKVTFCNRTYSRTVTDAEDTLDGQDIEDDFIDTKSANGFNWLRLNLGNGVHDIVVKATLTEKTAGDATAEAVIGNRTLIVEPAKLANDAVV